MGSRWKLAPTFKGELFSDVHVRYVLTLPAVIQIMISQVIVGYRTWNITQGLNDMGVFLLVFGFVVTTLKRYSNFDSCIPLQKGGKWASTPVWKYPHDGKGGGLGLLIRKFRV